MNPIYGVGASVPVSRKTADNLAAVAMFVGGAYLVHKSNEADKREREAHWGIDPSLPQAERDRQRLQADADYKALVKARKAEAKAAKRR